MSTTVKTGWLNDKNGDKFAPKTLTSQVQTSDGILIEDKIQTDLDTVKQEILDTIDPNTIMNYLGEVNELPEPVDSGDLVKIINENSNLFYIPIGEVNAYLDNAFLYIDYSNSILNHFATIDYHYGTDLGNQDYGYCYFKNKRFNITAGFTGSSPVYMGERT
jgi:hypothetical protein